MSELSRVTLVLPTPLWEEVKRIMPTGQRSHWVAEILEAELCRQARLENLEKLAQFQDYLRQKYGELPSSADEIEQMREERDHDIESMR